MSEDELTALAEEYGLALDSFLARDDEDARLHAYELGRRALMDEIGLLDIVAIHHLALRGVLGKSCTSSAKVWLARAAEFLGECLGPFEMSQRGYREANHELRRMNDILYAKNEEIARANRELEAFSYSVAHDLRAPLRTIDGFSRIVLRDQAERLDEEGREHLRLVHESVQRMGRLLEDMLQLSRYSRAEMHRRPLDLAAMARETIARLQSEEPERSLDFTVADTLPARGDASLIGAVLENLLGNAWKYTRRRPVAIIELGWSPREQAYFVRDNGTGFDMAYAGKLFKVFQRLHSAAEFEGTGVGLSIVQRIIERHGGRIWAEALPEQGATFFFTLPDEPAPLPEPPGADQE